MKRKTTHHDYVGRRLAELAAAYGLDERATSRFGTLLELLSQDAAPTTVHDSRRGVDVHIADSLTGLAVERLRHATSVADLGAGAGLPALVLAVALPDARVYAVESVAKKADFIRGAAAAMDLANVEVVTARAEAWAEGRGMCDVVCGRALAALPVVLEYAAPLLRSGGTVIAWKGEVLGSEDADGLAAAAVLGLERVAVQQVDPFPGADRRTLHVYSKVMETPPTFPRRPGIATKRPLSAKK